MEGEDLMRKQGIGLEFVHWSFWVKTNSEIKIN
jgi:hypothetical protein